MAQMMQDLILRAVERFRARETSVSDFGEITPAAVWRTDLGEREG